MLLSSAYTCKVNYRYFNWMPNISCVIASLLPSGPGRINRREAISDTQFHQHEQVHHQEQLPSSAWKFRQIQAFSFAHLLNAIAVHPPQQNHPANNWWGIINIPRQAAFPKGKCLIYFSKLLLAIRVTSVCTWALDFSWMSLTCL